MKLQIQDCKHPWESLQILTNGDVRICCWSNGILGNLNISTIDEIWSGSLITNLREYIKNNNVHDLCKNAACPYVQGLIKKENRDTLDL